MLPNGWDDLWLSGWRDLNIPGVLRRFDDPNVALVKECGGCRRRGCRGEDGVGLFLGIVVGIRRLRYGKRNVKGGRNLVNRIVCVFGVMRRNKRNPSSAARRATWDVRPPPGGFFTFAFFLSTTKLWVDDRCDQPCRAKNRAVGKQTPGIEVVLSNLSPILTGLMPNRFARRKVVPESASLRKRWGYDVLLDAGTPPELGKFFRYADVAAPGDYDLKPRAKDPTVVAVAQTNARMIVTHDRRMDDYVQAMQAGKKLHRCLNGLVLLPSGLHLQTERLEAVAKGARPLWFRRVRIYWYEVWNYNLLW